MQRNWSVILIPKSLWISQGVSKLEMSHVVLETKVVPIGDWGHLLTLTLTSDDLESHIVVNVSSTSNIIPSFIKIGQKKFLSIFLAKFEVTWLDNWEEIQKSGLRYFRYFGLVSETVGIFFDWLKNGSPWLAMYYTWFSDRKLRNYIQLTVS